jgi:hypothetical protein
MYGQGTESVQGVMNEGLTIRLAINHISVHSN